jgi:hypothetical protein
VVDNVLNYNEGTFHGVPYTKYYWNKQIVKGEMVGMCSTHGEMRNADKILMATVA